MDSKRCRTRFAMKAWVLMKLRGYRLIAKRSEPDFGLFGAVRYRREWVLAPPSSETAAR